MQNKRAEMGDLKKAPPLSQIFSNADTTSLCYELNTKAKLVHDTVRSYYLECFPERCKDAFLKKKTLTKLQKDDLHRKKVNRKSFD